MPEQAGNPHSGVRGRSLTRAAALSAAVWAVLVSGGLALAEEPPALPYGAAGSPCAIADPRLPEVSGLAVSGSTMLAMNDGGGQVEVYVLDAGCRVSEVRTAPLDPYDPEDLALAADGTIWLADIGDNRADRETAALVALRPDGSSALFRLTYPDGPHDAEALLLAPDGTPHLVTKEVLGVSGVYRPASALVDGGTVALARVGTVTMALTGTPGGPMGRAGQLMITGGAVSADGRLIALRTYTDAYVWPLTGSDVAGALAAAPVTVPLPEQPQGEAISFGANNRDLVVAGEGLPGAVSVLPAVAELAPAAASGPVPNLLAPGSSGLSPITAGLIAAGTATVVVWVGGKVHRRRE